MRVFSVWLHNISKMCHHCDINIYLYCRELLELQYIIFNEP